MSIQKDKYDKIDLGFPNRNQVNLISRSRATTVEEKDGDTCAGNPARQGLQVAATAVPREYRLSQFLPYALQFTRECQLMQ